MEKVKLLWQKIIVDSIPFEGQVEYGHQVKVGYYAQNQSELLDENKTIIQVIEDAADEYSRPRVRDMLGSFYSVAMPHKRK